MTEKRTIYRSPEGEAELMRLYDRALQRLGLECSDRDVDTRFGTTHLLCAGPLAAPPLVVFHGGNFVNPFTLAWFAPLADAYRIYAPDTVGHPGRSSQTRISPGDLSYGQWVMDILDGLGLECAPMVGPSYGAGIILRAAACAPERISQAVLVVPSGIVNIPIWPVVRKILIPMILYRCFPNPDRLLRATRPLCTEIKNSFIRPDDFGLPAKRSREQLTKLRQ